MEFVREILGKLEERRAGVDTPLTGEDFPNRDAADLNEHLDIMSQAGLIFGQTAGSARWGAKETLWLDMKLTWAGHDFLAASQVPGAWQSLKQQYGATLATLPFEIIKALLIEGGKRALGL